MVRIALDAMGGDYAPQEIVKGAVSAVAEYPHQIILVGDSAFLSSELSRYNNPQNISIQHASQVIGMKDSPAMAVKHKKDSSVNVAVRLVKEGQADAVISAGNTGALMASALFGLGRISGVERPGIATVFPTEKGSVLLLDMGANVDCKPQHLVKFAEMGSLYAEHVMHIEKPRVALLNIGEEAEKGNELAQTTYPMLKQLSVINFVGNVESKEILAGKVDVIVCDGFVGNLILKFGESLGTMIVRLLKQELMKNPLTKLGAFLLAPALKSLKKLVDYDEYGGAPLLGIDGVVYKAHGRAKAKAIKNALRVTAEAVEKGIVKHISK